MPHGLSDLSWRCTPLSAQRQIIELRKTLKRIRDYADAEATTKVEVDIAAWADAAVDREK